MARELLLIKGDLPSTGKDSIIDKGFCDVKYGYGSIECDAKDTHKIYESVVKNGGKVIGIYDV